MNLQRKLNMRERMAYATIAKLEQQLAERDALLREASEWIKANSFHGTDAIDLWERIDRLISASAEPSDAVIPASVGPSAPKRETCESCYGEGVVHTGVEESPTTLCNRCDGSGNEPSAPAELDERAEFDAWTVRKGRVVGYLGWREDFVIWQARAALELKP